MSTPLNMRLESSERWMKTWICLLSKVVCKYLRIYYLQPIAMATCWFTPSNWPLLAPCRRWWNVLSVHYMKSCYVPIPPISWGRPAQHTPPPFLACQLHTTSWGQNLWTNMAVTGWPGWDLVLWEIDTSCLSVKWSIYAMQTLCYICTCIIIQTVSYKQT